MMGQSLRSKSFNKMLYCDSVNEFNMTSLPNGSSQNFASNAKRINNLIPLEIIRKPSFLMSTWETEVYQFA